MTLRWEPSPVWIWDFPAPQERLAGLQSQTLCRAPCMDSQGCQLLSCPHSSCRTQPGPALVAADPPWACPAGSSTGRNRCLFAASTCLLRNWRKKSFVKELSNITAMECLALVALSPPQQGAAAQSHGSFLSSPMVLGGSGRSWEGRAAPKLNFCCCRQCWESPPLLTPVGTAPR